LKEARELRDLVAADDEVRPRWVDVHLEDDVVAALLHHQLLPGDAGHDLRVECLAVWLASRIDVHHTAGGVAGKSD
jgi:hypothetical protein